MCDDNDMKPNKVGRIQTKGYKRSCMKVSLENLHIM